MMERLSNVDDDQAAAWVARMDAGQWNDADEAELQTWLAGNHRRSGLLLQAQAAWLSMDVALQQQVVTASSRARAVARTMPIGRRRVFGGMGAIAASLLGGVLWFGSGSSYSTELGEIRKVPLADGSSATINSLSRIDVRLASRRREIRLDSGEAWFQVAKDASRPFIVESGSVVVQAVGTAFSVRRRTGGAEILVTEGVVEGWAAQADGHKIRLVAGQHAFIGDNAAIRLVTGNPSDVDRSLAWRAGSIDLKGRSLTDAIAEFNRYNRRRLVLDDQSLGSERFDGIFRTDDPEGFAGTISRSFGTPVNLRDPAEIRIGRRND